jgi:hypothetical protein
MSLIRLEGPFRVFMVLFYFFFFLPFSLLAFQALARASGRENRLVHISRTFFSFFIAMKENTAVCVLDRIMFPVISNTHTRLVHQFRNDTYIHHQHSYQFFTEKK